jgi:cell division protease FtsH
MSDKFGMMGLATVKSQYLEGAASMECADRTAADVDGEVREIIETAHKKAIDLLKENRDILDHIAGYLYRKETITGKEFMDIFRRMKGFPEPESENELSGSDSNATQSIGEDTILPDSDDFLEGQKEGENTAEKGNDQGSGSL